MYAQGSNVCSSFATDPEYTKMPIIVEFVELAFVYCTYTQLTFDGRDERWSLEQSTSEGLQRSCELSLATW